MKVDLYDKNGKKTTSKAELAKEVFEIKVNEALITQAVYVYLSNQRQANAQVKDRSAVSGGGKKPWRQKGTGRARHGSSRSPIWSGGGVTFGPSNNRNYKKKMSKKMRAGAIASAFSKHAEMGNVYVFEGFELGKEKLTQSVLKALETAKIEGKTLIIQKDVNKDLVKAVNNIQGVDIEVVNSLTAYTLVKYKNIIILQDALEFIEIFWGAKREILEVKEESKTESKKTTKETK